MTGAQHRAFHEDLQRSHEVVGPSNRQFGLTFAVVFLLIAAYPLLLGNAVRLWSLTVAGGFLVLALGWPRALTPFNRLWLKLGLLLHRIVTPIVLGITFFGVILPTRLVLQLVSRLPLDLGPDEARESYWSPVTPDSDPDSLRRQF